MAGDKTYVWFADRETNLEYRRPEYFLCMIPQSPEALAKRFANMRGLASGCSQLSLVRLANDESSGMKGFKLVDYDREGIEPHRARFLGNRQAQLGRQHRGRGPGLGYRVRQSHRTSTE